jgi:hypothetical protein
MLAIIMCYNKLILKKEVRLYKIFDLYFQRMIFQRKLSDIICETTTITELQKYVFLRPNGDRNPVCLIHHLRPGSQPYLGGDTHFEY